MIVDDATGVIVPKVNLVVLQYDTNAGRSCTAGARQSFECAYDPDWRAATPPATAADASTPTSDGELVTGTNV